MNQTQSDMIKGFMDFDPQLKILGSYRGNPVLYTKITRWQSDSDVRHVVVLHKNGNTGNIPKTWYGENFIPTTPSALQIVHEYIARTNER